jgi:hypothetical protein
MATSQQIRRWTDTNLGYVGAALAYLVAGVHLFHPQYGVPRLVALFTTESLSLLTHDPRPVVFVLSALGILLGVTLTIANVARKRIYALGMALMTTYFIGYFAWHLTGHGGFLPGRQPLYHGLHPIEAVISHLINNPLAAFSKLTEAVLFVVLAVLYREDS